MGFGKHSCEPIQPGSPLHEQVRQRRIADARQCARASAPMMLLVAAIDVLGEGVDVREVPPTVVALLHLELVTPRELVRPPSRGDQNGSAMSCNKTAGRSGLM